MSYANATSGITVNLSQTSVQPLADGDKILNFENVIGTDFDDVFFGTAVANIIDGGKGRDQFVTGDGNDKVSGGDGNDIFNGDLGADTLDGGDGDR